MKHSETKLFILILSVLFIADLFDPVRAFSSLEKRPLAQFPQWDLEDLINGDYTLDLESTINDQFILRDQWVLLKAGIERFLGKTENNGILYGKDGTLFEKRLVLNPQAQVNINVLKTFLDKYARENVTVMIVPGQDAIRPDLLPEGFPMLKSLEILNQWRSEIALTTVVDALLDHKDDALYYKTDHHWTLKGAYVAYQTLMDEWGLEALPYEAFTITEVDGFLGTYANRSRFQGLIPEKLQILDPAILSYTFDDQVKTSLIDQEALSSKDPYRAFLYGNLGFASIRVRESDSPKRLLVIKDSYANSLIPFMTSAFDEIDVIDLRSFNGSIENVIASKAYDHILILQNFNSFCDEINEVKLKY